MTSSSSVSPSRHDITPPPRPNDYEIGDATPSTPAKNIFQIPLTTIICSESSRIDILSSWTKSHFTLFFNDFCYFSKNAVSQIISQKLAPGTADSGHNRSLTNFECSASKSKFMLDILVFIEVYKSKGKSSIRDISKIACVRTEISAKMRLFSIYFGVFRNGIPAF